MTLTEITSSEEAVSSTAHLELLSAPTFESSGPRADEYKSITRKARGFIAGLTVMASLAVAVGVFHVGGITPSTNHTQVAQLASAVTTSQLPAVVMTSTTPAANSGAIASLGTVTPRS